jgi:8-oxo-dGTP pyrophosphatase MutT (NUDIX family)
MISKTKPFGFVPKMTVSGAVLTHGDEVLLLKRASFKKKGANKWAICAGKCEEGETPLACIQREIQEEVGLELSPEVLSHFETYYFYHDDDVEYTLVWEVFTYNFLVKPDIIINREHSEYKWVPFQKALDYDLIEGELELLQEFFKNKI